VNLDVRCNIMQGAKGKEADYVVLVGMVRRGMPSTIEDDPLLQLAMPAGDSFTDAEERRLFYVALTRTKRSVLLLTVEGQESPFLLELIRDGHLTLESGAGEEIPVVICPKCGVGRTVRKNGRYGEFYSCSTYPECDGKLHTRARR